MKLFKDFFNECILEKKVVGGLSKRSILNTAKNYKTSAITQGFNVKNVNVKSSDIGVAKELVENSYNALWDRCKIYLNEYIKDKNRKRLEINFQFLNKYWNDTTRNALAQAHTHAPTRIAIYNKFRQYNSHIPEIKYTESNQPVYYFHLIPVYIFDDVLDSPEYKQQISKEETDLIISLLINKFRLSPDQAKYLKQSH